MNYTVSLEIALSDYANIGDFKELMGEKLYFSSKIETDEFDLVVTLGGDGTILWAHRILNRRVLPPFVCFDGGSLCFLSNFSNLKVKQVLTSLHEKVKANLPLDTFALPRLKGFVRQGKTNRQLTL